MVESFAGRTRRHRAPATPGKRRSAKTMVGGFAVGGVPFEARCGTRHGIPALPGATERAVIGDPYNRTVTLNVDAHWLVLSLPDSAMPNDVRALVVQADADAPTATGVTTTP